MLADSSTRQNRTMMSQSVESFPSSELYVTLESSFFATKSKFSPITMQSRRFSKAIISVVNLLVGNWLFNSFILPSPLFLVRLIPSQYYSTYVLYVRTYNNQRQVNLLISPYHTNATLHDDFYTLTLFCFLSQLYLPPNPYFSCISLNNTMNTAPEVGALHHSEAMHQTDKITSQAMLPVPVRPK